MVMIQAEFIRSSKKFFLYYKNLGEKAISQLEEAQLFLEPSAGGNSIAIIVQHMAGNMHSRWASFPNGDGESATRNRDAEFELHLATRAEVFKTWESGWEQVFTALERIEDVLRPMQIRGETIRYSRQCNVKLPITRIMSDKLYCWQKPCVEKNLPA
jgi:hypothetical protein